MIAFEIFAKVADHLNHQGLNVATPEGAKTVGETVAEIYEQEASPSEAFIRDWLEFEYPPMDTDDGVNARLFLSFQARVLGKTIRIIPTGGCKSSDFRMTVENSRSGALLDIHSGSLEYCVAMVRRSVKYINPILVDDVNTLLKEYLEKAR